MSTLEIDQALFNRANDEAAKLNHDYIGSEHLLAAILADEQSPCVVALKQMGASPEAMLKDIARLVQCGPDMIVVGRRPRTPRAMRAIEFANEAAGRLGAGSVGDVHVMLGLLDDNQGVAFQVLLNTVIDFAEFKERLMA